jgi:hypothetical protein
MKTKRILISLFLFLGALIFYSCKPNRTQIADKEIMRFISNMDKTVDLLQITLEKMDSQIEDNSKKIEELQLQLEYLKNNR